MSEYLIKGETLTSLANNIRDISGDNNTLSPTEMTNTLEQASIEIDEQSNLLAQIATALEGKASGSGGNNNDSMNTYTVNNNLDCEVSFGATYIAAKSSMQFPTSSLQVSTGAYMLCAVHNTDTSFTAYLNNTACTMSGPIQKLKIGTGLLDTSSGFSGYMLWFFVFRAYPVAGDVLDIGTPT